jgi:hypothetical protein
VQALHRMGEGRKTHVVSLIFQVFQMFRRYDANGFYKSRSGCCICCKWLYTYAVSFSSQCFICFSRRMLQVFLLHMFHICCKCFYLDVAYVLK